MSSNIIQELADWIDADVIAELIIDELEDHGEKPTLKYAKNVWLDVLEHELHDVIKNAISVVRSL